MANKYAKKFPIPEGFPTLLKDFTREVLREQPTNIYEFGFQYFSNVLEGGNFQRGGPSLDPNDLRDKILGLFNDADADGSGSLDHREFKSIFRALMGELGLTSSDVRRIMAEADENEDGVIEYREFVPIAVDVVQSIYAKRDFEAQQQNREQAAKEETQAFLLHGMPRQELEELLEDIFRQADVDGSGQLSRREFAKCIRESDLGFTRKEVNALMAEVDGDGDGSISYEEFVPLCFRILVDIVSEEFANEAVPTEEHELAMFFTDLFHSADAEDTGLLYYQDIMDLLRQSDLGLTRIQIHALMSEAEEDGNGCVRYTEFAHTAAGFISAMTNFEKQQEAAGRLHALQGEAQYQQVGGLGREDLEANLLAILQGADTEETGLLPRPVLRATLENGLPQLSNKQVNALMSLAAPDPNAGGDAVPYSDVVRLGYRCLQSVAEIQVF